MADSTHPDLPAPPRARKWSARLLLVAGAVTAGVGAAHFAGLRPMDANLAFVLVVGGVAAVLAGVWRRATTPRRADVLHALYLRAEPVRMLFLIRPVQVKGQAHVEYVADVWEVDAMTGTGPALTMRVDRYDDHGVPWFVSLSDGQEAWVHGGGNKHGPAVLEVDDRLVLPATLSSVWRRGQRGGKKWRRPAG